MKLGGALLRTVRHYFPEFHRWLDDLPDRRCPEAITYDRRFLAWWGIALYLLHLGSRRQLDFHLDARGTCVLDNLNRLARTAQTTRPVHDTLDYFVGRCDLDGWSQTTGPRRPTATGNMEHRTPTARGVRVCSSTSRSFRGSDASLVSVDAR